MDTMVGPPPAASSQQQPPPGPFTMANQNAQQQQSPPDQAGSPQEPLEGQLIMATIQMRHMLKLEPSLGPWVNDAIAKLQSGVRTILSQRRQANGGSMPVEGATPSMDPGSGLPF